MKKFDVVSIGSSMRDIFIKNRDLKCPGDKVCHPFTAELLGEKISVKRMYFDIGGGGSNSAATFGNMGLKAGLMSRVGKDLAGNEVIKVMKKFGVDTALVEVSKTEETGYSVIFLDKDGDRTALVFRGAADFNNFKKLKTNKLKADWFYITALNGNLTLLKQIFALAKKKGIKIGWNPGNAELALGGRKLKPLLNQSEIVFLNLKEAQGLVKYRGKEIKKLFDKLSGVAGKTIWCVTGAKKGAWVQERKDIYWAKILDKVVVNATGAGDAFGSGMVSGLMIYNGDLVKSLQLAMLNSNQVVTKMGAKHGLLKKPPTKKILDKIKIRKIK